MTTAPPFQRVLVLGNSGAGKSTFARAVGARYDLNVVHLDRLFWKPGWVESSRAEFRTAQERHLSPQGCWVVDGNSVGTLDLRLPYADTVVLLDLPTSLCLRRVVWRALTTRSRPDMAAGCHESILRRGFLEFLHYVATWRRNVLPSLLESINSVGNHARVIRLRSADEVTRFLVTKVYVGGAGAKI